MVIPKADAACFANFSLLAVVAALAAYSFSILPAYFCLSATFPKLSSRAFMLVSNGAIDPSDSEPNSSFNIAACLYLSIFEMAFNTDNVVPSASFCMS